MTRVEIILNEYPILEMKSAGSDDESGFDWIPEADTEEITTRFIAKEFGISYDWLNEMIYHDYLIWLARYKAVHWTKPDAPDDGKYHGPYAEEWMDDTDANRKRRAAKYGGS